MYRYLLIIVSSIIILFCSCGDNGSEPVIPKVEITCNINGYINLSYSSSAVFTKTTGNNKYLVNASGTMYGDTNYKVLIAIVYPTSESKPGSFPIVSNPFEHNTPVVFAQFSLERNDSTLVFPADSGTVEVNEIDSRILKGSFWFSATEKNGSRKVSIQNGMLDIFNF